MGKFLIWTVAIFVMATLDFAGKLSITDCISTCIVAWVMCKIFFSDTDDKVKVKEEEVSSTERDELTESILRATEELRRRSEEYAKQQQRSNKSSTFKFNSPEQPTSAVPVKVVRLSADSVKTVRNMLMRHHEMKRTDTSYQESQMAKDTNHLLVQLNDIIASHK